MTELTFDDLREIYLNGKEIKQDEESVETAKEIHCIFNYDVVAVYENGGINIIINKNEYLGINRATEIASEISDKMNMILPVYVYSYIDRIHRYLLGCFSEIGFLDQKFNLLPQVAKIYKAKGFEINFEHIYHGNVYYRQFELNIFYKNRWKLKKQ